MKWTPPNCSPCGISKHNMHIPSTLEFGLTLLEPYSGGGLAGDVGNGSHMNPINWSPSG